MQSTHLIDNNYTLINNYGNSISTTTTSNGAATMTLAMMMMMLNSSSSSSSSSSLLVSSTKTSSRNHHNNDPVRGFYFNLESKLSVLPILLMIAGTFGNSLAFYVLTRKRLRTQSTMLYFATLTLMDTLALYQWYT